MPAIVDTGPLVAFFDRSERHHAWAIETIEELEPPLLVCEPVLAEASYLLGQYPKAQDAIFQLLQNGAVRVAFHIDEHLSELRKLLQKYRDTPMSLADACVVRMAEVFPRHAILTLDADFSMYRKQGKTPLPILHPTIGGN